MGMRSFLSSLYTIVVTAGVIILPPQPPKPNAVDSLWLKESWIKNCDKWKAANEFAHKNNAKFIIITEKFFE